MAIGGRFAVLDHVSRPDVYATLHGPLLEGYALDALEARPAPPPPAEAAEGFVAAACGQRLAERDGSGWARGPLRGGGLAGAALLAGGQVVQLTAFAEDDGPALRPRVRRPSRRA